MPTNKIPSHANRILHPWPAGAPLRQTLAGRCEKMPEIKWQINA
jgi:hypothetical protein